MVVVGLQIESEIVLVGVVGLKTVVGVINFRRERERVVVGNYNLKTVRESVVGLETENECCCID